MLTRDQLEKRISNRPTYRKGFPIIGFKKIRCKCRPLWDMFKTSDQLWTQPCIARIQIPIDATIVKPANYPGEIS